MLTKSKSKPLIKPKALRQGDKVGLVCPGGRPESPAAVARSERIVSELGLKPIVGEHTLSIHGFMAGTDEERLADIVGFIKDPSITAVFCIEGGYGSMHLLPLLDYDQIAQTAKLFVGGDDNTCLLNAIHARTGLVSLLSPNLSQINSAYTFECLKTSVMSKAPLAVLSAFANGLHPVVSGRDFYCCVEGSKEGRLVGGNLTSFASLLGTGFEPEVRGSILCLEDFSEQNGILDRWFTSLYLAGHLQYANAVVLGSFENCSERANPNMLSVVDTFADRLKYLRKTSCFGLPFGHAEKSSVLPIGVSARLDAKAGTIEFLESALY